MGYNKMNYVRLGVAWKSHDTWLSIYEPLLLEVIRVMACPGIRSSDRTE